MAKERIAKRDDRYGGLVVQHCHLNARFWSVMSSSHSPKKFQGRCCRYTAAQGANGFETDLVISIKTKQHVTVKLCGSVTMPRAPERPGTTNNKSSKQVNKLKLNRMSPTFQNGPILGGNDFPASSYGSISSNPSSVLMRNVSGGTKPGIKGFECANVKQL